MSSAIFVSKQVIIEINTLKSQKTSDNLDNLYIDDKKNRGKIRIGILYLVSYHFQRLN